MNELLERIMRGLTAAQVNPDDRLIKLRLMGDLHHLLAAVEEATPEDSFFMSMDVTTRKLAVTGMCVGIMNSVGADLTDS